MDFENTFAVKAPIEEVYAALLDLERVAPAMPGAQVLSKTSDDSYKVAIKVKLGPVSMTYRGDVAIVERDPAAHTALLDVKAKEARGQGTANAKVQMSLVEEGDETRGTMKAQVQLAGKAAAMGRGIIEDVSARLVQTFAQNLEGILASGGGGAGDAAAEEAKPEASRGSGEAEAGANGGAAGPAAPSTAGEAGSGSTPRPSASSPQPDDDGLPVLPLVASMAADRMRDPRVLGGVLGGVLLLGYAIGRARG